MDHLFSLDIEKLRKITGINDTKLNKDDIIEIVFSNFNNTTDSSVEKENMPAP